MTRAEVVENYIWLIENQKDVEFEAWCKKLSVPQNPLTLHYFRKECEITARDEKMTMSFSSCGFFNGYMVVYVDEKGKLRRFREQSEHKANELFSNLKSRFVTEKWRIKNGEFIRLA